MSLASDAQLAGFPERQELSCHDTLDHDLCPSARDLMYTGLTGLGLDDHGLPAAAATLEDSLDEGPPLFPGKTADNFADGGAHLSLPDLGPEAARAPRGGERSRPKAGPARKGRRQPGAARSPLLDCSLCGKAFSSASSLSKHYLTHSQERKHVCQVCAKAFKRQDHLTGHMLTHQKTKPFTCLEAGCSKSYCDYRSLRRHYEVQHGLRVLKEPAGVEGGGRSLRLREAAGPAGLRGLRALVQPGARSPAAIVPDRALLRCLVSSLVGPKPPDPGQRAEGPAPDGPGASDRPGDAGQGLPPFPPFPGRGSPRGSRGRNVQWVLNWPAGTKGRGGGVLVVHGPSAAPRARPEGPTDPAGASAPRDAGAAPSSRAATALWPAPGEPRRAGTHASQASPSRRPPSPESPGGTDRVPAFLRITESQRILPRTLGAEPQPGPPPPHDPPLPPSDPFLPLSPSPGSESPPALLGGLSPGIDRRREPEGAQGRPMGLLLLDDAVPAEGGSRASAPEPGFRPLPAARRLPGLRRDRLDMLDSCCTASPSQVAMASFSAAGAPAEADGAGRPKLTLSNRIQGGNVYSFLNPEEKGLSPEGPRIGGIPSARTEPGGSLVCQSCGQWFYTEKGLKNHFCFHGDQWPPPLQRPEAQGPSPRPEGDGPRSPEGDRPDEGDPPEPPLMSPVPAAEGPPAEDGSEVGGRRPQEESGPKAAASAQRRPRPKSPFLPSSPPPPSSSPAARAQLQPGTGGCYKSCLRSPLFLWDHLLRGLLEKSPYTPPPMLSPVREGSGLYFNLLCASSPQADPGHLYKILLDPVDASLGISILKDDDTRFTVQPHINMGSQFQAETPNLQDQSLAEKDKHAASLVWKPWGDLPSSQEAQNRVTDLCNTACSSVLPGGGTNLELALHCLHEAKGDTLEALETLLISGPQKTPPHPLADYHYTGSDAWTPAEKQLFRKAFCVHKKDFHLVQKAIRTKNVAQCVEYYYIWKKMIKFDCGRAAVTEMRARKGKDEVERTARKVQDGSGVRMVPEPTGTRGSKRDRSSRLSPSAAAGPQRPSGPTNRQGSFPCRECDRVFDKIKSRNAHMKRHRVQEHAEFKAKGSGKRSKPHREEEVEAGAGGPPW
ncbi:zinc finger protein 541 [Tachyglossus aculeatus]|uniref:zinc finger protein 541 n=1 Tax=Tachyglossus aculeatus TaxID=9261 RepID=UPI0018F3C0BF|nr:zinc finger protein 541 [Tachyglossus aculeatus]